VLAGLFFKLALFPMHFWVPDIYQGASNETTAYVATLPKLGAVALLIRFVPMIGDNAQFVAALFMVLALASMFYGNLSALVQSDIKRMLGFSGISHAGFVLLGLLTMEGTGYGLSVYYITGYVLMNLACFLVIANVSDKGENLRIDDLGGLYRREPVLALVLTVGFFALAGIPPFVGFMGKFMLLTNALAKGYLWLVILAALNTAIAIYYYLSAVKAAYTTEVEHAEPVEVNTLTRSVGVALVVLIVLAGVFPSQLVDFATSVVMSIL